MHARSARTPEGTGRNVSPRVAEHFEDLEQQAHAARFGMWVFLASEALLFGALFVLYAAYRVEHPLGFGEGVRHNARALGSINTLVLLCSSYTIASSVRALRDGKTRACLGLAAATIAMGAAFLVIKGVEYAHHFKDGVFPGGAGDFFAHASEPARSGLIPFYTLYYGMTGLHAIHVIVGMLILGGLSLSVARGAIARPFVHPLEIGAIYWHLVDVIWIFLWPLFYLTPGSAPG